MQSLSVQDARERLATGARLLDVREYPEWMEAHLETGTLVPLGELRSDPSQGGTGEVLVLCRSGKRAEQAAEILSRHGSAQPFVIQGGIEAWRHSGLGDSYRTLRVAAEGQGS